LQTWGSEAKEAGGGIWTPVGGRLMNIRIGAPVMASDGRAGTVDGIVLHPQTREIDGVVVCDAELTDRRLLLPVDEIASADDGVVRVRGSILDVAELNEFARSQYVLPPEDWIPPTGDAAGFYLMPASPLAVGAFTQPASHPDPPAHEVAGLADGDYDISGSTEVHCLDGAGGRLERVVTIGSSDHVSHLVVRRTAGGEVIVPVELIQSLGDEGIYLSLELQELDEMPRYEGAAA
jgi:hypothetical protein